MRTTTTTTANRWAARLKTGDGRAQARITIQALTTSLSSHDHRVHPTTGEDDDTGEDLVVKQAVYASMVFGQSQPVRELENIRTIEISRSVDADAQSCTIDLYNTDNIPIGATLGDDDDYHERPGWYTFNRGDAGNPWGLLQNGWRDWLVPDRIVRTYEGYGIDRSLAPDKDPNMYPSGVWLIDDVTMSPDGSIRLACRDLARELLEQVLFPPVVPKDFYPLVWEREHVEEVRTPLRLLGAAVTDVHRFAYEKDSSTPYVGKGLVDGGAQYVRSDGSVRGHHGRHAFDPSKDTYWMSVGNRSPKSTSAWEYVQGRPDPANRTVHGIRVRAWGGPYTVYVSVKVNGRWQGSRRIGYRANLVDTKANIRYVTSARIGRGKTKVIKLPRAYQDVQSVRVTLHDLFDSKIGTFPYRGGARSIEYTTQVAPGTTTRDVVAADESSGAVTVFPLETATTVAYRTYGNYTDYADIVKTLLAWAGFHWPEAATGRAYVRSSDGTSTTYAMAHPEPVLAAGSVWGDVASTGVGGADQTRLESEIWDQKPVMDGIRYVKDIVAYTFFVDETGGAVFRSPNIWKHGNYLSGTDGGPSAGRTTTVIAIEDDQVLLSHSLTLSSRSRRDRIFIASSDGRYAAVARGYNPFPSGTRRVGGWTDQHFESQAEVNVMANLIAVRAALKYRAVAIEIPGNPAIQIDDQVVVRERITGTDHLFYVASLASSFDAQSGRYTYRLGLQWLGTPASLLTVDDMELRDETRLYLESMGLL